MRDKWFISDPHFGHNNIIKYCRPKFRDTFEMDEMIIANINAVVKPNHKLYLLGDLACTKHAEQHLDKVLPRLNGHKRLIMGNHDTLDPSFYAKHFEKVLSWRHFTDKGKGIAMVMTHFPLHEGSFLHRYKGKCINVHGHLHERKIVDSRYVNVCVECTDYKPMHYDELMAIAAKL